MALREIVTLPDPVLRRKAHKVVTFDKDLQILAKDMLETMREANGVGLAAPQIGLSTRFIVIEYAVDEEKEDAPKKTYMLANPEIIEKSEEKEMGVEGCLSVVGLIGDVERHLRIVVKAQNLQGKPVKIKVEGWLARIFQHEIDHLDGIVFTDIAESIWQPSEEEKSQIVD
jgi:peptide deformylase